MENKVCVDEFINLCEKYGFSYNVSEGKYVLVAKNTDGGNVNWIKYNLNTDKVTIMGNTDNCNLWFSDTKKDFTPDKIINFVDELNKVLKLQEDDGFLLKELIDPEDWQEIARVRNAYDDPRYNKLSHNN